MAEGRVTRGTTGVNRLRRMDRWIAAHPALRRTTDPLVVDLGFGASAWTTIELFSRLREVRPDARVTGLEIDPVRVRLAAPHVREGLDFAVGGFDVPLDGGRRPAVIRAANVLRQYDEHEGEGAWRMPMGANYDKMLKSDVADMKNVGDRAAGSITAAQFLKRFVKDETPWIHLDIAGVALTKSPTDLAPKGATGWGVLALNRLVDDMNKEA